MKLRKYQEEALQATMDSIENDEEKSGLLHLATGAGKTVIAAAIAKAYNKKVLFLIHREELAKQTISKFKAVWPEADCGLVKAEHNNLGNQVTVASIQTLAGEKRLDQLANHGPYDLVICDEAHHAKAPVWQRVTDRFKDSGYILGLTATPERADRVSLLETFHRILYKYDIIRAIKEGALVDIKGRRVDIDLNLDTCGTLAGDFKSDSLSELMTQDRIISLTVDSWQKYASDRKTVAFCVSVAHCNKLKAEFSKRRIPCEIIIGDTPSDIRNDIYSDFSLGKIKVLISCMVLTEGWDEPAADCILMARPTLSGSLWTQMVGRGLRLYPGKENCLLLDVSGNSKKHKLARLGVLMGAKDEVEKMEKKEKSDTVMELPDEVPSLKMLLASETEFNLTSVSDERRFEWVETEFGLALSLGNGKHGFFLVRKSNEFNSFEVVHHYSSRLKDREDILTEPMTLDWTIALAEDAAERFIEPTLNSRDGDWRKHETSQKQIGFLRGYGIKETPKTKGEAANLITKYKIEAHIRGRELAIQNPKYGELLNQLKTAMASPGWTVSVKGNPDKFSVNDVKRIIGLYKAQKKKAVTSG